MRVKRKEKKSFIQSSRIVLLAAVLCLTMFFTAGCSEDSDYTEAETSNLTDLTKKLAVGGSSPLAEYSGSEGLWGVPQELDNLRNPYTDTANAQSVTMMVYMIGSNLESEDGSASADIQEMLDSRNGSALNIVVETGGAEEWQNKHISADRLQRWLIQNGTMTLQNEKPSASMCTRGELADFIAWSAAAFPADRYILILWDHGGGTMDGFGYDELYPDDNLSLAAMTAAVRDSGIKLDVMAFDACLMGTLEIAYAFEPLADYLLASEETEPGEGWFYTEPLRALSERPSMTTLEFGARIIDSYAGFYLDQVQDYYGSWYETDEEDEDEIDYEGRSVTMSLVDLREVPHLYEAAMNYYANAEQTLASGQEGFTGLSSARSRSRSYGDGDYEQIDLVDYIQRTAVAGAEELIRSVFSAVKYRNNSSIAGSYGTAVYFPYSSPEYYSGVMAGLAEVNYTGGESFYNAFLSVLASSGSGNEDDFRFDFFGELSSLLDLTDEDWYDSDIAEGYDYQSITDELTVDYSDKYDAYLLSLSDDEWESIIDVQLQVMLDDGEGYIDLGSDQQYDWTDDGKMILDFDDTWVSIDGHLAAFYAAEPVQEGNYTLFTGTVPALLNDDTEINLYLRWRQDENGEGTASVMGYIPADENGTRPKGYLTLKPGDVLQLLCDYYTYDGEFDDQYCLGDPFTVVSQEALSVDWYDLEESTVICWLRLTDWFNQYWYTETIEISYE